MIACRFFLSHSENILYCTGWADVWLGVGNIGLSSLCHRWVWCNSSLSLHSCLSGSRW